MNKTRELLIQCKKKLGIETDYKLAQAMEIHRARISAYMAGKETPDFYTCLRIAEILDREPTIVIAEVQADTEKNEQRKSFFKRILHHAKKFEAEAWRFGNRSIYDFPTASTNLKPEKETAETIKRKKLWESAQEAEKLEQQKKKK